MWIYDRGQKERDSSNKESTMQFNRKPILSVLIMGVCELSTLYHFLELSTPIYLHNHDSST